jgi:PhnB protein
MAVKPIPDGYTSLTPYLIVTGAKNAIDYYTRVFGATELMRMEGPGGTIVHAELQIGSARMMIADEMPDMGFRSPHSIGGCGSGLMLYVDQVDGVFEKAVAAGATVMRKVENQFYGDRSGTLTDPFGHIWTISTHVEDVSEEEMERRMAAAGSSL